MKIEVVMPGKTEESVKANLLRLLKAANILGVQLEAESFARAWMSDNTRVFIATDGEEVKGFSILVFGRRYYDPEASASVLIADGEGNARNELLKFMLDTARVLGAKVVYFEGRHDDEVKGELLDMRRVEI